MYSKKGLFISCMLGVVYINRTAGGLINWGLFIEFKGLLCGISYRKGENV